MNGFLLDTNVPSELTRPQSNRGVEKWLDEANDNELFLSVITMGEVLKGITAMPIGRRRDSIQRWLDDVLRPWFRGRILPVTIEIAERWGVLASGCQRLGRSLKVADGLIAATALDRELIVVTRNVKDFRDLGVQIIDPWV